MASYRFGPSDMSAISQRLAEGGHTITLKSGTYTLNKNSSNYAWRIGSNTTLIGESGSLIVMGPTRSYPDNATSGMILLNTVSHIRITGLSFTGNNTSGDYGKLTNILIVAHDSHHLEIDSCIFVNSDSDFIKFRNCHDASVHNNRMWYSGHECLYLLNSATAPDGNPEVCYNISFYNNDCRTRENGACRLGYGCHDIWIHHNTISGRDSGYAGNNFSGPAIEIDKGPTYNVEIYENTFTDIEGAGIWAFSNYSPNTSKNLVIRNNTFTSCGTYNNTYCSASIVLFQFNNTQIYNNRFAGSNIHGALYIYNRNSTVQSGTYNISFTNNRGASSDNLVYNKTSTNVVTASGNIVGSGGGAGSGGSVTPPSPIDTTQPSVSIITNATTLTRGNSTTLNWSANNCTSAVLNTYVNGTLTTTVELPLASLASSSGAYSVTPTATSVYTIIGYYNKVSPTRSANSSTQITVTDPVIVNPSISSITTSKTTVYTGEDVNININGAKNFTYANIAIEAYTGHTINIDMLSTLTNANGYGTCSTSFSVTGTKSVILTLKNGSIVKTFTPAMPITVIAAPTPATPSLTLSASFTEIIYGDEISLNWTCTNATSLIVNGLPQSSITTGSISVSPGSDAVDKTISHSYTYTAIATNTSYGLTSTATKTITITVNPYIPKVPLVRLRTDTQLVDIDQPATISWFAENTNSLSVNYDIGAVNPVSGSIQVYPTTETTYVFSAIGDDGANNTSITIDVLAEDIMSQFVSTPTTVYPGDQVTLAWASRFGKYGNIDNDIGAVNPASGTHVINPTVSGDYVFTVSGSMGVDSKTIHVSVLDALPSGSMSVQYSIDKPLISSGELSTISWTSSGVDAMACGQDIGFVDVPSGSIQVYPYYTENYEFIAVNGADSLVYEVPIYVIGEDYELIHAVIPTYTQDYIDITGRRIYVSGGQSTSDTQYTWDIDTNASMRPNPDDEMITFSYDEDGYYMITLTSVDHDGNITKQTVRATVINT